MPATSWTRLDVCPVTLHLCCHDLSLQALHNCLAFRNTQPDRRGTDQARMFDGQHFLFDERSGLGFSDYSFTVHFIPPLTRCTKPQEKPD
jgi:hypothetical protein